MSTPYQQKGDQAFALDTAEQDFTIFEFRRSWRRHWRKYYPQIELMHVLNLCSYSSLPEELHLCHSLQAADN